jgi:hypothetical protein
MLKRRGCGGIDANQRWLAHKLSAVSITDRSGDSPQCQTDRHPPNASRATAARAEIAGCLRSAEKANNSPASARTRAPAPQWTDESRTAPEPAVQASLSDSAPAPREQRPRDAVTRTCVGRPSRSRRRRRIAAQEWECAGPALAKMGEFIPQRLTQNRNRRQRTFLGIHRAQISE